MRSCTGLCVSLVSHGHAPDIERLLGQLATLGADGATRVVVTLNLPEPALAQTLSARVWPFELTMVDNPAPKGFGANHNHAFALDACGDVSSWFAVLNPDLHWQGNPFYGLRRAIASASERVGLVYPVQVDVDGRLQDHERRLPTPGQLLRRYLIPRRSHELGPTEAPDWVNAAFVVLRREAFAGVGGFDERFHMYGEDVDLCLRLQLAGWQLRRADDAVVVHGARRASHRDPSHLVWHLRSLWRLWRSPGYSQYLRKRGP